jgi:hypothetical protein
MRAHRAVALGITVIGLVAFSAPVRAATVTTQLACTKSGVTTSAASVMAANTATHAASSDYKWAASSVKDVRLKATYTITQAGTYRLHGKIANGQLVVNVSGNGVVRLILAGVSVTSRNAAAIDVQAAAKVVIVLQAKTNNVLVDGASRPATGGSPAALYSKTGLTIMGSGALKVTGRYGDAIASSDGLVITGGIITVKAMDDGIRGKDFVYISGGKIAVTAASDGIRSMGKKASTVGYVYIGGGQLAVNAQVSAVHGLSDVVIAGGKLTLKSGADAITSSCVSYLEKATVSISAGKKAVHSNGETVVRSGVLNVTKALEGLEGASILISGGKISLVTTDDGLNATAGPAQAASSTTTFVNSIEPQLQVSGGTILINALGDGIDINGTAAMSGGTLIISGPTSVKDAALDLANGFAVSGGVIFGVGSADFAMGPSLDSAQSAVLGNLVGKQPAGTILHVVDAAGKVLASFKSARAFGSAVFSSPAVAKGHLYRLYAGGTVSGPGLGGYFSAGTITGATLLGSFTAGSY